MLTNLLSFSSLFFSQKSFSPIFELFEEEALRGLRKCRPLKRPRRHRIRFRIRPEFSHYKVSALLSQGSLPTNFCITNFWFFLLQNAHCPHFMFQDNAPAAIAKLQYLNIGPTFNAKVAFLVFRPCLPYVRLLLPPTVGRRPRVAPSDPLQGSLRAVRFVYHPGCQLPVIIRRFIMSYFTKYYDFITYDYDNI